MKTGWKLWEDFDDLSLSKRLVVRDFCLALERRFNEVLTDDHMTLSNNYMV